MKRKLIFMQILLCLLLFVFCITIHTHSPGKTVTAGSFGKNLRRNLTFEDCIHNSCGDLF